jgi:hypothetical protein
VTWQPRCTKTLEVPLPDSQGLTGEVLVLQCIRRVGEDGKHPGMHRTPPESINWAEG